MLVPHLGDDGGGEAGVLEGQAGGEGGVERDPWSKVQGRQERTQ